VFAELEAELAQCAVDRKHDAIDRKNLLIANDNLIAECLSKEVFSVATKYELNVARFAEMYVANTSVEARCLALEAELATLHDKSHQENQGELIKHFSKLEVDYLNLQLKYQNFKNSIGNNPPTPEKDTPDLDSVFVIGKMQASLQGKDNVIRQLKKQLSELQVTSSETECTIKVRTTDSQLTKVTDPITNLQAQNDRFRAENDKVKQHYKKLYDSIKITRAKHIEQVTKLTAENVTLKTSVSQAKVQPSVPTRTKHAVDVELIVPRLRNNRDAQLDYLRHLKESVETIHNIVEEAKVAPNNELNSLPTLLLLGRRVKRCPKASESQPKSNHKTKRISPAKGANKLPVEDLPRMNKSHLRTMNRVDSSSRIKRTVINLNSDFIFQTCKKCLTYFDHDMCVAVYVKSVMLPYSIRHNCKAERKIKRVWKPKHVARKITQVWKPKQVGKVWKPTEKVLTTIGHQWRPTGWILHLGTQCPLTRFTPPQVVSAAQSKKQANTYANQKEPNHNWGSKVSNSSSLSGFKCRSYRSSFVRFGNDHFGAIMGYGDYVVGESVISRKTFVLCLRYDCLQEQILVMASAFNHLNFGTINDLARKDLVRELPRLKFKKAHLCSACQLGKSKKHTHKPKAKNTNLEVLNTLHMDLCGLIRVQTINGKKYILFIMDDYSRFTWVKFLRSKDETPKLVIKFITQIQVGLNKTVRYVRTDNGTEFVNHTMTEYYERIGIFHQKTVPRTPQQNGVAEKQNRTLVEAARTMLIFSKASMFLWAEAVATACYTQNRSLIHTRHHKTPYELVHNKKPDLIFFRVFGALCYPTNDSEDLGKLQPTADTGIFVGYAPSRKGYRIYNKRT
nr:hypothetical protein [Tanacetum cinerariifolium]